MNTIQMTIHDGKLMMDQDYEFSISDDTYFSNDMTPFKEVKFNWNLHMEDVMLNSEAEQEEVLQQIGEKLKKDFISFMRHQNQIA